MIEGALDGDVWSDSDVERTRISVDEATLLESKCTKCSITGGHSHSRVESWMVITQWGAIISRLSKEGLLTGGLIS